MNPIAALSDLLSKLVIERGSAVITEKNLAFLRDQLAAADKENVAFKENIVKLEMENESLKTDNKNFKKENNELKNKIQFNNNSIHISPDDMAIKILQFLWEQQEKIENKEISKKLSIDLQIVNFHLEHLEKQNMVHGTLAVGQPRLWSIIQDGRKYLIENKLIS